MSTSFRTLVVILTLVASSYSKILTAQPNTINDSLIKAINADIRDFEYGKISSIVILNRKGQTIYDNYFKFSNNNTLNQTSSVCKSITSVLVGICLNKGFIKSLETPIYTYFPEYDSIFRFDTMKKLITIDNLLKQTCGLKWEEWKYPYNYVSNSLISALESGANWIDCFFKLPNDTIPGTKFSYNSLATQILAEIIQRASGIEFNRLTCEYLFEPMRITNYNWELYPNNKYPAWGGISLTTNDMAKFGLLVTNYGKISNTTIVDSAWIAKSTKQYTSYNDSTGYAMHWWIDKANTSTPIIYAAGYGDQYVYIIESKGIVIAINAQNFSDYRWPKSIPNLVDRLCEAIQ